MESKINVCREILSLGGTMEEGLDHLANRMGEGHLEDTRFLFADIQDAFRSISMALEMDFAVENEIPVFSERLQLAFDKMNRSYEDNKLDSGRMDMQFVLYPAFKEWMQEINRCLRPLIQS